MRNRAAALASIAFVLLALCGWQAAGASAAGAALDPGFGGSGVVTLPPEVEAQAAFGAALPNGDLVVSGGPTLTLLSEAGVVIGPVGTAATLGPAAPGKFSIAGLAVDPLGRLLVVGTSRFPAAKTVPLAGGVPVVSPSAIRVLRFLPDGTLDPSFGSGGVVETDLGLPAPRDEHGKTLQPQASIEASGIAFDPQGGIVVTGRAATKLGPSCEHDVFSPSPIMATFVGRLTETGELEASFGNGGVSGGRGLGETPLRASAIGAPVVGPDGTITYRSTAISPCKFLHGRWGVAQLTAAGTTRRSIGKEGVIGGYFTALAADPDGSTVAMATERRKAGEPFRARLIRIGGDGKVDSSFGHGGSTVVKLGSGETNTLNALAIDAQGRILIGGTLAPRKGHATVLIRLSAAGRQEMNFGPQGRVASPFPRLVRNSPTDLFFDSAGRAVIVQRYEPREGTGLAIARFLLAP